ncbi:hypothetical protein [Christiangramia aquimixticola]|uniref:hypothetical protein n=1 Tax=Christiangramia aquimixticola TaxID=1697558 RepID=UPI003AA8F8CD
MKRFLVLLIILSCYACSKPESAKFEIKNHIPADTELFLLSPDLGLLEEELATNKIFTNFSPTFSAKIQQNLGFLKDLQFNNRAGISFSRLGSDNWDYLIITKKDSSLINLDSIQNKSVESLNLNGQNLKKIGLENDSFYLKETGNANLISNSRELLLDFQPNSNPEEMEDFFKVFNATDPGKTSILFEDRAEKKLFNILKKFGIENSTHFAGWSAIDFKTEDHKLIFNGLSLKKEDSFINRLQQSPSQEPEASKITPKDFISFYAISSKPETSSDSELADTVRISASSFPEHIREVVFIKLNSGNVIAFNAQEIEAAKEKLAGTSTIIEEYRENRIYEINTELKWMNAYPYLNQAEKPGYYTVIDHFLLFSTNTEPLKKIISAVLNSDTLENNQHYLNTLGALSSRSSVLMVENISFNKQSTDQDSDKTPKLKRFTLAAYQLIAEENFSHLHGIISEPDENDTALNEAEQQSSIKINSPIATSPVFFRNHRTDQMDIVVQDQNNNLYLVSNQGNIFWKKKLDSKITSPVYQVDLFKNGNKQLAFSTGYNLEVIDRTGKDVKPFPVKFNDPLSQPLAVFDYDNNRTYRFVMVQGKRVYMLGPKGKPIKGFDFENASSNIIKTPKHIRLGHKDYILIAEQDGKLNILNRQGGIRVPVTEKLDFSTNDWFGYDSKFVGTDQSGNLLEKSPQGNLTKKDLGLAENHRLAAEDDLMAYLNENELVINEKSVSLDFGLYTSPQIFKLKRRTLVAITDTQANKVYVFNKNGELLNGFPVYGSSEVDLSNADLDSKTELVVRGDENEILVYEF